EPALDPRQLVLAAVVAPPGDAAPLEALDHRSAFVILEPDLEHPARGLADLGEVLDVALVLEHLRDGALGARGGHAHRHLLRALRVADAREHVGDRIGHHGSDPPLTSSPSPRPAPRRT